jgi:hypothetical protein
VHRFGGAVENIGKFKETTPVLEQSEFQAKKPTLSMKVSPSEVKR